MRVERYPYCCRAVIFSNFSGGHAGDAKPDIEKVRKELEENSERLCGQGMDVAVAIITKNQEGLCEVFNELGWYTSEDWHGRPYEQGLRVYFKYLGEK